MCCEICFKKIVLASSISLKNCKFFWSTFVYFHGMSEHLYRHVGPKKKPPLFISIHFIVQKWNWYQLSWIGTSSTSVWCFKFFLTGASTWGEGLPKFNFFYVNPQMLQRNCKVHLSNCLETNFHNISNISLRVDRRKNYS